MLPWCFLWLVWLLCACGVRRIKGLRRICLRFSLFFFFCPVLISLLLVCFSLPLLFSLVLLSSCLPCLFVLSLWVLLLFLFPLRYMCKKKGRKGFAPCVLSSFVVGLFSCSDSCNVVEKLPRCVFGFFQFVRLVFPTNTTGVRRLAGFYFDFLRHNVDITYNPSAFLK